MSNSPEPLTDRDLLRRIERSAGGRAGYKQLIRELGLGGGHARRLLREQLGRLTGRKDLVQINGDTWSLPSAVPERTARPKPDSPHAETHAAPDPRHTRDRLVAGRLDLHRDGYGFVRPNGSTSREDDLFIPPPDLHGAMQGDEVLVDEAPPGRPGLDGKPRRSGRILRILTRRNPTVVGIFHYARSHRKRPSDWVDGQLVKGNYVTPLDERINAPILIPDGAELLPATPENPNRTLGEEARAAWHLDPDDADSLTPLEGLAVDVEITDFPQPGRPAKGRLLEILGPPDAFGVDVEIIIRKHHLPHVFPANVLGEATDAAQQTVEAAAPADLARRHDFRHLPVITIDGETARDFDDAVLVRDLPDGHSELQVHIADVSHYVQPATALDLEARLRGTSVYFPDRAVPMLPPELSSGICSLRPDEDRFVLSCLMEIDPAGEIVSFEVGEGIIRSAHRMTYTDVQRILDAQPDAAGEPVTDADKAVREKYNTLAPDIDRMLALALRLNAKRKRRGSIDFDLPEPVVQFDPEGNMAAIVRSERGWAHRLIEEFMLSANECVSTWIERQAVPSLFRIHEMPDPKRIVDFEETAAGFGVSLGIGSLPVKKLTMKSDRRESRRDSADGRSSRAPQQHTVPERIPVTPQMYQRLAAKIAGTPEERILAYLMLRSLKQARYAEKNEGHFALASPSYTHFTSPIRRYPDLIVHRLLRDLLERGADPHGTAIHSGDWQPWQAEFDAARGKHREAAGNRRPNEDAGPIPAPELEAIATESSQSERRADDAERELIEWKKIKFMEDRVGEDFPGIILSCTKYGIFVELADLFIEGIIPIASLSGFGARDYRDEDRYAFRDTDRSIVGSRSGRVFRLGQPVRVLLDRIDRQQRRLQFALLEAPGSQPQTPTGSGSLRRGKHPVAGDELSARPSPNRSGKPKPNTTKSKKRLRDAKSKGKRRS